MLKIQQEITKAIKTSVITSVNRAIEANLRAYLGASIRGPAQGASSPKNTALSLKSVEHSSAIGAAENE